MKQFQSVGSILSATTGLLVVMLVYFFVNTAAQALIRQRETRHVLAVVKIARDIVSVRQNYRVEMGAIDASLTEPLPADSKTTETIANLHKVSRSKLDALADELRDSPFIDADDAAAKIRRLAAAHDHYIPAVLAADELPVAQRPGYLSNDPRIAIYKLIDCIDEELSRLNEDMSSYDPFISKMMGISDMTWRLRADAGSERRTVASMILGAKQPSAQQFKDLNYYSGRIDSLFDAVKSSAKEPSFPAPLRYFVGQAREKYFTSYRKIRDNVVQRLSVGERVSLTFPDWIIISSPGLDSLMTISAKALDLTEAHAKDNVRIATVRLIKALLLMFLSLGLGFIGALHLMKHIIRPLKAISTAMAEANGESVHLASNYEERKDEIGQFARSLARFRAAAAQRRQLEFDLNRNRVAKEAAEASNRVRAEFLANMSHELRTPLNAILGFSEMIKEEVFGKIGPKYIEYAGDIYRSGSHLLDLINDVLDLSKIDAGKMEIRETEFSVSRVIDDATSLMAPRAKHVCLKVMENSGEIAIRADERLTKQILLNLLSNALKFTEAGEVVIASSLLCGNQIEISVSDTGIGMTCEELGRALEQYGQVDSKVSKPHRGSGLGLPLSKSLAELQGGKLLVASTRGVGTTVKLILPAERFISKQQNRTAMIYMRAGST